MSNGEPTNFNNPPEIRLGSEGLYIYEFGTLPTEYETSPAHSDTYIGYSAANIKMQQYLQNERNTRNEGERLQAA